MKIQVNGELQDITARTLAEALVELNWGEARVATALNGSFVPKAGRAETILNEGDQVEVLAPMQGG
jgi:sulfur carrier protein